MEVKDYGARRAGTVKIFNDQRHPPCNGRLQETTDAVGRRIHCRGCGQSVSETLIGAEHRKELK